MPRDLERLLRESRKVLGEPDGEATRRAHAAALAAAARTRLVARRSSFALAFALVAAVAVGIGIGALAAPSSTAAQDASGIGFLPADGWYVVQNARKATEENPAHAIASNVPLSPGDGGSIVPYGTLLGLPRKGVVLVANFVAGGYGYGPPVAERPLPLEIDDATPGIDLAGEIRPAEPLGQYQLRAMVNGYLVELHVYYGTRKPTKAHLEAAQEQLDRLVVASDRKNARTSLPPLNQAPANGVTLDVERVEDAPGHHRLRFSGQIASSSVGEYIAVMQQRCGYSHATAVAGAQAHVGGFWSVEPDSAADVIAPSATFRARWGHALSDPVTIKQPISVEMRRLPSGRFGIYVSGSDENLTGRAVILQRLRDGKWSGIQRGRLARVGSSDRFVTTFPVTARGWTLRARVPKATAGKCLAPAVTRSWTS